MEKQDGEYVTPLISSSAFTVLIIIQLYPNTLKMPVYVDVQFEGCYSNSYTNIQNFWMAVSIFQLKVCKCMLLFYVDFTPLMLTALRTVNAVLETSQVRTSLWSFKWHEHKQMKEACLVVYWKKQKSKN